MVGILPVAESVPSCILKLVKLAQINLAFSRLPILFRNTVINWLYCRFLWIRLFRLLLWLHCLFWYPWLPCLWWLNAASKPLPPRMQLASFHLEIPVLVSIFHSNFWPSEKNKCSYSKELGLPSQFYFSAGAKGVSSPSSWEGEQILCDKSTLKF